LAQLGKKKGSAAFSLLELGIYVYIFFISLSQQDSLLHAFLSNPQWFTLIEVWVWKEDTTLQTTKLFWQLKHYGITLHKDQLK